MDDVILTSDDIEFLKSHESGIHLTRELKEMLSKNRKEVDFVTADGLPIIQGRITAIKNILTLLGADYE